MQLLKLRTGVNKESFRHVKTPNIQFFDTGKFSMHFLRNTLFEIFGKSIHAPTKNVISS